MDGRPVPGGALAESAGRVVVQFRLPPGEHKLLISSLERRNGQPSPLPPQRIFYVSQQVRVKEPAATTAAAPPAPSSPLPG